MHESVNFDRAIEYYDQTRGFPSDVVAHIPDLFIRTGNLTADSRLLEIGVGTGRIALPLAPYIRHYSGLDISTGMMSKLIAKRTSEPISLVQGDAARMPFASASFHATVAVHVFHLIPAWREVLIELARVLKPGGMLLHGWNGHVTANALMDVWNSTTGATTEKANAVSLEARETFLLDVGWTLHGDPQVYPFTFTTTAGATIDNMRERRWSHCWRMTDEQIDAGLQVVTAYAAEYYPDLHAPIDLNSTFHVQAYLPPTR